MAVLLSCLFLVSCARVSPVIDLQFSTDRRIIESIQDRSEVIKSINATLSIKPAAIASPKIEAYMLYGSEGMFRLTGLTPTGFTLFDFETSNDRFSLLLSGGRRISGRVEDFLSGFKDIAGVSLPAEAEMIKEALDFHGIKWNRGVDFLIEDVSDYYILSQLASEEDLAYPLRRWWIDKGEMTVVRKEIFSRHPDMKGERLFEAVYGDFRIVDDIKTPFVIEIKGGEGERLLTMKFNKVEYNKDKK